MTAGVLRGNFGDMGADDDEGGNNHTQYNGKPGYSQMDGDSNASVTASENSDQMEEGRITTLKNAPIQSAAVFKKYLLWSSQYKVMSKEQTDAE